MTKTKSFSHIGLVSIGATFVLFISLMITQSASAMITSSLDVGARGTQVTELQTYLATNATIYPSGLVTGYYGPLTEAAVERFQTAQGIVSSGSAATTGYGRVGPTTMARINALNGSQVSWDTVPMLSSASIQLTRNSAIIAWSTNEATQGQVYFDIIPLRADEATGPNQIPYISGSLATDNNGMQTSHSVNIQNLQPNTIYYYLVKATDSAGNISVIWPSYFRTNQ
jgi:peptidoglycan hydrolase-like protein with peptidoglycan-binding domain